MLQVNEHILRSILKDFYTLTQIRIVLIDSEFNEVLRYPEKRIDFCRAIRENPKINASCVICDKKSCLQCAETKQLVSYRCHTGLVEAVVPIFDQCGAMGYIMFGQLIPADDADAVVQKLKKKFSDQQFHGIAQMIDAIPVKSPAEINAAATVLQALTVYVLTNRWVIPQKSDFIRRLDAYIEANLTESISVDDLCGEFRIGRTRLYDLASSYLGCGLAEYIRGKRIEYAQRLLTETELSVTEIAFAAGFSDYNHFSRVFRQLSGVSARRYRQKAVL